MRRDKSFRKLRLRPLEKPVFYCISKTKRPSKKIESKEKIIFFLKIRGKKS